MEESERSSVILVVPKELVKTVKNALEALGKLDRKHKIQVIGPEHDCSQLMFEETPAAYDGQYLVPTTIRLDDTRTEKKDVKISILEQTGLQHHAAAIILATRPPSLQSTSPHPPPPSPLQNPLLQHLTTWLRSLPPSTLPTPSIHSLLTASRYPYTIYPPLLLLPPTTFTLPPWPFLLPTLSPHLPALYALLTTTLKVTHIALNAPIPLLTLTSSSPNVLRSPTALIPLHGDFGPALPATHIPSQTDFTEAFWVSTRQNGIFQTWAPRYTMFSRGNIREKARILGMKQLTKEGLGGKGPGEISAVDLYAGIGYFAFCYAEAGVGRVFCWELNWWSVEGMRRGAAENGWGIRVVGAGAGAGADEEEGGGREERLMVFQESNEKAAERIEQMRETIPPVRHVNCGFLPSSEWSWEVAVRVLDPAEGGWVHAHENIGVKNIERRKREIVEMFTELTDKYCGRYYSHRRVYCEHVERVKGYAPGVIHYVLDIAIGPGIAMSAPTS